MTDFLTILARWENAFFVVPALVTYSLFHWVRFDQPTLKLTTTSVIGLELAALSLLTWLGSRPPTSHQKPERAVRDPGDAATS